MIKQKLKIGVVVSSMVCMVVVSYVSAKAIINKAEDVTAVKTNSKSSVKVETVQEDVVTLSYDSEGVTNTSINLISVKDFFVSLKDIYGVDYLQNVTCERIFSSKEREMMNVYSSSDSNVQVVSYEDGSIKGISVVGIERMQEDIANGEYPICDFTYKEIDGGFYLER